MTTSQLRNISRSGSYALAHRAPTCESERNALIEAHLHHVKFIAERIAARLPHNIDREDLIGAGLLGLLDAANRFDPSRGVMFKTYAELRIRGAILDSLRGMDSASRQMRQRAREVEAAYAAIEKLQGRPATEEEAADYLGMKLSAFQILLGDLRWLTVTRIDEEDEEERDRLAQQLSGNPDLIPSAIFERTEQRQQLIAAIDRLPKREREVISLYYLEELTMKEVGAVIGITESRVCQIHTQAVLHLRSAMKPTVD